MKKLFLLCSLIAGFGTLSAQHSRPSPPKRGRISQAFIITLA